MRERPRSRPRGGLFSRARDDRGRKCSVLAPRRGKPHFGTGESERKRAGSSGRAPRDRRRSRLRGPFSRTASPGTTAATKCLDPVDSYDRSQARRHPSAKPHLCGRRPDEGRGAGAARGGARRVGGRNAERAPGPCTPEVKTALRKKFRTLNGRRAKAEPSSVEGPRETDAEAALPVPSPGLPLTPLDLTTTGHSERRGRAEL